MEDRTSGRRLIVLAQSGVERRPSLSRYAGSLLCTPPSLSSALRRHLFPLFPGAIPHAKPALVSNMRLNSPPHYAGSLRSTTPALSLAWPRSSPPRCSHALPRTSPCYASFLPCATPAHNFPLQCRSFCTTMALFFPFMVDSFTLPQRYSLCCDSAVFLTTPFVSFAFTIHHS